MIATKEWVKDLLKKVLKKNNENIGKLVFTEADCTFNEEYVIKESAIVKGYLIGDKMLMLTICLPMKKPWNVGGYASQNLFIPPTQYYPNEYSWSVLVHQSWASIDNMVDIVARPKDTINDSDSRVFIILDLATSLKDTAGGTRISGQIIYSIE